MTIHNETIAALSTPPGKGGIAVIRLAGDETRTILGKILELENLPPFINPPGSSPTPTPPPAPRTPRSPRTPTPAGPVDELTGEIELKPRRAYHGFIVDKEKNKRWDECIVVFFKGPHSYTGEDMAEISIHGNPFLAEGVLDLIYKHGARPALPGEFTYRAYKNGKMDLIQAESVNELIHANSAYYATIKLGSLEGRLSQLLQDLKDHLVQLGIKIETKIEFEEDQYFDEITITKELEDSLSALQKILANSRFNETWNKGLNVVIAGQVNVGKSSLFNALLLEERSIISHLPGTTRDFIKEKLYIDGLPVQVTDVAGINRETRDEIENRGIERTLDQIANCDAVIFLLDASRPLEQTDLDIYQLAGEKQKLIAVNKIDIGDPGIIENIKTRFAAESILEISVKKGLGIDLVREFLKSLAGNSAGRETGFAVNSRQKAALEKLQEVLQRVMGLSCAGSANAEIAAEEIREAIRIIGDLLGEVTTEEMLHKIFSQFCVGK